MGVFPSQERSKYYACVYHLLSLLPIQPEAIPPELHAAFAVVVADPPYLAAECLTKTAATVKLMRRAGGHAMLLTGATMQARPNYLILRRARTAPNALCKYWVLMCSLIMDARRLERSPPPLLTRSIPFLSNLACHHAGVCEGGDGRAARRLPPRALVQARQRILRLRVL